MPPLSRSTIAATKGDAALGVLATRRNHGQPHQAAVPRRPCRQPAAPARSCWRRASSMKQGKITPAELRTIEDEAIRDAVKMQEEIGLQGVTDGEFRRGSWHMDFLYQVGGVTKVDGQPQDPVQERGRACIEFTPAALRVTEQAQAREVDLRRRFPVPASRSTKATPKLTIPSPSMMHYRGGRAAIDEKVYPDLEQFWDDLGQVYARRDRGARASSAAPTCSSTTPASPISTTRRSASTSASSAATASTSTSPTSASSTRRWPASRPA